jgi:hypothetical protein
MFLAALLLPGEVDKAGECGDSLGNYSVAA